MVLKLYNSLFWLGILAGTTVCISMLLFAAIYGRSSPRVFSTQPPKFYGKKKFGSLFGNGPLWGSLPTSSLFKALGSLSLQILKQD